LKPKNKNGVKAGDTSVTKIIPSFVFTRIESKVISKSYCHESQYREEPDHIKLNHLKGNLT
jgi:hypothetical protein